MSVNACLKLLPALAMLELPAAAGAAAIATPEAGAFAVATAASDDVLSTAGAGAVAEPPLGASAAAMAGDLLPAAPRSGAELCCGEVLSAGEAPPCRSIAMLSMRRGAGSCNKMTILTVTRALWGCTGDGRFSASSVTSHWCLSEAHRAGPRTQH